MTEFTTLEYLLSYPGMLAVVIMLTQFSKKVFAISGTKNIERILYVWCLIFAVFAVLFTGDFTNLTTILSTILVWLVNSVIIWWAALKAFEKAVGSDNEVDGIFILDQSDPDTDRFRVDFGENLADLGTKTKVTLSVDTDTKIEPS